MPFQRNPSGRQNPLEFARLKDKHCNCARSSIPQKTAGFRGVDLQTLKLRSQFNPAKKLRDLAGRRTQKLKTRS
jgi:hypothetical protein